MVLGLLLVLLLLESLLLVLLVVLLLLLLLLVSLLLVLLPVLPFLIAAVLRCSLVLPLPAGAKIDPVATAPRAVAVQATCIGNSNMNCVVREAMG